MSTEVKGPFLTFSSLHLVSVLTRDFFPFFDFSTMLHVSIPWFSSYQIHEFFSNLHSFQNRERELRLGSATAEMWSRSGWAKLEDYGIAGREEEIKSSSGPSGTGQNAGDGKAWS